MKAAYKKIHEMMIYKGLRGRIAHVFGVIDHIDSSGNWYADFLPDGSLFDYKNSMEGRKVFVSDYFDDDDDSVDGNADSYVCNLVKAWNAEYVYSAGIAQFFWKYVLYLSVQTIYEVTADQCDRSCAY